MGPLQQRHAAYLGKRVLLGVRPEAISPADGISGNGADFTSRVEVVEPTGDLLDG